jgi:hypothetical protein
MLFHSMLKLYGGKRCHQNPAFFKAYEKGKTNTITKYRKKKKFDELKIFKMNIKLAKSLLISIKALKKSRIYLI